MQELYAVSVLGKELTVPDRLYFDDFEIRSATRQLTSNGKAVPIGARAFDLLLYLILNRDRVVSRDELMEHVWSGVFVGNNNLNVQVSLLRKLLGPQALVTVPGRGLRFGLELKSELPGIKRSALSLPDKPSVVVLPFSDFGVDKEFTWLPDCIVEDITTELSRFHGLFVVARNSAFTYRDRQSNLRDVSRELGVRYVVEGSVRTAPNSVRVTARLIDTISGGQVWAENFDCTLDAPLEVQIQITGAVVAALAPQIDAAESSRTRFKPSADLNGYGLAQKGWFVISAGDMSYDRAPRDHALALAEKALAIDSNSALAWRTTAWVHWWHAYHCTTDSVPETLRLGVAAAGRAISIDGCDHHAWRLKALLDFMSGNPEAGLAELRRSHDINPNCATTLGWLGFYEATHGNTVKGVPHAEAALRLSPRDPSRASLLVTLGFTQFVSRDYLAASNTADKALLEASGSATPLILGAISKVGSGQIEAARAMFEQLDESAPKLAKARLAGRWLSTNSDYKTRAQTFLQIAAGTMDVSAAERLR